LVQAAPGAGDTSAVKADAVPMIILVCSVGTTIPTTNKTGARAFGWSPVPLALAAIFLGTV